MGAIGKRGMLVEVDSVRRVFAEEGGHGVSWSTTMERETIKEGNVLRFPGLTNGWVPVMAKYAASSDWAVSWKSKGKEPKSSLSQPFCYIDLVDCGPVGV